MSPKTFTNAACNPFDRHRLTIYRQGRITDRRRGLHMLVVPEVGGRLVLYAGESRRRIITGPVVRVLRDPTVGGTYFQTRNSLYLLEPDVG